MPQAAATAKRGAHVACTVAALHDGMPVAVAERRRHERGADDVRHRLSCAGGRGAWHRWPPCRRGKGGRERREVRWAATGHSSGVLRQFARCWGHSWSHAYMESLKKLLVDVVWLRDLGCSSAWRYTSLGRNTVALGVFFKSAGTKTYKRGGMVCVASFKRTAIATGWASESRPSSMLWASPATSSLPRRRGSRSTLSCQLNMLMILAASLLRSRRLCRRPPAAASCRARGPRRLQRLGIP